MTENYRTYELDELYSDLKSKAAIDVGATVKIIEAIEQVMAGKAPAAACSEGCLGDTALPGKAPAELARQAMSLRPVLADSLYARKIFELRDSLYRYQSL